VRRLFEQVNSQVRTLEVNGTIRDDHGAKHKRFAVRARQKLEEEKKISTAREPGGKFQVGKMEARQGRN